MIPALVAAIGFACTVAAYRIGVTRRPPRAHDAQSYWAGYRRGHADGQQFATSIERTPSAN